MSLYGSVSCLILINSLGRDKNRGHHGKIAVCGRNHVTHYVSVIVLASPDESAFASYNSCYGIIDQGVEILDSRLLKLLLVLLLVHIREDVLEVVIVCLGDGILGREPQILLG